VNEIPIKVNLAARQNKDLAKKKIFISQVNLIRSRVDVAIVTAVFVARKIVMLKTYVHTRNQI
jgi:hypothetical protein